MAAEQGGGSKAAGGSNGTRVELCSVPEDKEKFGFTGQVLTAIVVTAAAGSIFGARRFRKTMTDTVSRNAQRRKAEAESAARAARDRGARANAGGAADGHPLRGRIPKGWEFDDSREAAFAEQRLNSQVVQHLSTLGVRNFVAGSDEVKAAYRGKAMTLHPDRRSADCSKQNDQEFKKVAESYAWLDNNYFRRRPR
ncbi:DnaJ domain containing protein [Ectocarpus siliculosus]|uniref:DnaJ domain containing protein n=1 Tax=Ectocarpus siliculosus TaxID=2880 RepID=D8LDD5_ECTSI|nr:DnaJ domain containing protein [Ectocarpus siliculosus]|eukprot:CBN80193.1 DnaJ domain containing protein [Ectocarpus siliculosus]